MAEADVVDVSTRGDVATPIFGQGSSSGCAIRPSVRVCVHDPFSARLRRTLPILALLHVFLLSRHTTRLSHQTNRSRGPIMDGAHRGTLSLSLSRGVIRPLALVVTVASLAAGGCIAPSARH